MHRLMKLCSYKLWTHLVAGMEQTGWVSLSIIFKGVQEHGCHCARAWYPTHLAYSPRRRQEASLTRAKHVFWQVDVHGHQHTLGGQHRHCASVCHWSSCTQVDDVHVIRRVGHTSHISVPKCNRGKSLLSVGCHHWAHGHHHKRPSLALVFQRRPSWGCQSVGLTTTIQFIVMSCMACLSLFCLTWVHV